MRAFTLVELIVTIMIIGVLSAVMIPKYNSYISKARFAEVPTTLNTIQTSQEIYYIENSRYKHIWSQDKFYHIGLFIPESKYFYYYCPANRDHYWGIAYFRKPIGKHSRGSTILINEDHYKRGFPRSVESLNKSYFK